MHVSAHTHTHYTHIVPIIIIARLPIAKVRKWNGLCGQNSMERIYCWWCAFAVGVGVVFFIFFVMDFCYLYRNVEERKMCGLAFGLVQVPRVNDLRSAYKLNTNMRVLDFWGSSASRITNLTMGMTTTTVMLMMMMMMAVMTAMFNFARTPRLLR